MEGPVEIAQVLEESFQAPLSYTELFRKIPSSVVNAAEATSKTNEKLQETIDKFSRLASKLETACEIGPAQVRAVLKETTFEAKDMLQGIVSSVGKIFVAVLVGLVVSKLTNFSSVTTVSVTTLATMVVPFLRPFAKYIGDLDIVATIATSLHSLFGKDNFELQAGGADMIGPGITLSLLCAFMLGKLPKQKMLEDVCRRFDIIGKASTGIAKLDWIEPALEAFKELTNETFGREIFEKPVASEVERLADDLEAFNGDPEKFDGLRTSPRVASEFYQLHQRYIALTRDKRLMGLNDQRKLAQLYVPMNRNLRTVFNSQGGAKSLRAVPLTMCLYGDSGIGKTTITNTLIVDVFGEELKNYLGNSDASFVTGLYSRNTEQEYWDDYRGQPILIVDDCWNIHDSAAKPDPWMFEVIRATNTWPFALHMAALEQKDNTVLQAKGIVMTANRRPEIRSIRHPTAVLRRIHVSADVAVNAEFMVVRVLPDGTVSRKVNWRRVRERYPTARIPITEIYEFRVFDSVTGERRGVYNYSEFVDFCRREKDELRDDTAGVAASTEEYFRRGGIHERDFELQAGNDRPFEDYTDEDLLERPNWRELEGEDSPSEADSQRSFELYEDFHDTVETPGDIVSEVTVSGGTANPAMLVEEHIVNANLHMDELAPVPGRVGFFQQLSLEQRSSRFIAWIDQKKQRICDFVYQQPMVALVVGGVALGGVLMVAAKTFLSLNEEENETVDPEQISVGIEMAVDPKENHFSYTSGNIFTLKKRGNRPVQKFEFQTQHPQVESDPMPDHSGANKLLSVSDTQEVLRVADAAGLRAEPSFLHENALRVSANDQQCSQVLSQVQISMGCLELRKKNEFKIAGTCLNVAGSFFLLPYHVCRWILEKSREEGVSIVMRQATRTTPVELPRNVFEQRVDLTGVDLSLISLGTLVPLGKNLTKHFMTTGTLASFEETPGVLMRFWAPNPKQRIVSSIELPTVSFSEETIETEWFDETVRVVGGRKNLVEYYSGNTAFTTKGNSGSVIIARNQKLAQKIIGLHMGVFGIRGNACVVSREELEQGFRAWNTKFGEIALRGFDLQSGSDLVDEIDMMTAIPGEFVPIGRGPFVASSSRSKLQHSPIFGMVSEPTTAPAMLKPFEGKDPKLMSLMKAGGRDESMSEEILDMAVRSYKPKLMTGVIMPEALQKTLKLSFEQAILGFDGEEGFPSINRSSSAGYPFCLWSEVKKSGGKKFFFGDSEQISLETDGVKRLRKLVDQRIEAAKKGESVPTIWLDMLKDERRPIEKVLAGKTRTFVAGPLDYNILCNMYFGAFKAHLVRNRLNNEIAIGIDPFSVEWNQLATRLQSKGTRVVAGDFSSYDGSMKSQILWKDLEIIEEWYRHFDQSYEMEDALVRKVLFADIVNSVHLCDGALYQWTHSLPSGCVLTAHLNSINNSLLMRCAWILCGLDVGQFDKAVFMISFGDDNVLNIADGVLSRFNQKAITSALAKIQFTYTDEEKSGEERESRELRDVLFLKRHFVFDTQLKRWKGPLRKDVIYEMLNWVRESPDPKKAFLETLEMAVSEMGYHSEREYEKFVKAHTRALARTNMAFSFPTKHEHFVAHLEGRPYSKAYRKLW